MGQILEGDFLGNGMKIGIVVARFNRLVSDKLLEGAVNCLKRHGCEEEAIDVLWVPGSFEIPVAAQTIAQTKRYDGIVCLGTLVRGETAHFDCIASQVTAGISRVALDNSVPITFGVLTTDTLEHALDRAGGKSGNKGEEAAMAVLEMVNLLGRVEKKIVLQEKIWNFSITKRGGYGEFRIGRICGKI